jgi:hypothetical protein
VVQGQSSGFAELLTQGVLGFCVPLKLVVSNHSFFFSWYRLAGCVKPQHGGWTCFWVTGPSLTLRCGMLSLWQC